MRLDKWLKVSRLIKRRAIAQAACDAGRVQINGRTAKPASAVRAGDRLRVELGRRLLEVAVLQVPEGNVPATRAAELYRTLQDAGSVGPDEGDDEEE